MYRPGHNLTHRFALALFVAAVPLGYFPSSALAESPEEVQRAEEFPIAPLLRTYCIDCHSGDAAESGIAIDQLLESPDLTADRRAWDKIAGMLRVQAMPPDEAERPSDEEYRQAFQWLSGELDVLDRRQPPDPGRVTVRRLNRAEYNNTVRDLFGIDIRPADAFPADDVGYGFDNIGDVLSLPPLLMEKYLDAAEQIVEVVLPLGPPEPANERIEAERFAIRNGGGPRGDVFAFPSVSTAGEEIAFPYTGDYVIRVEAYGQQAGGEPARMVLKFDDRNIDEFTVEAESNEPQQFEHRRTIQRGAHRILVGFVNDYYRPDDPDPANRDRNLYVDYLEIEGPYEAQVPPPTELGQQVAAAMPSSDDEWEASARRVLEPLVRRAYRRPATERDVERLLSIVDLAREQGDSFTTAMQLAVQAILVSPHFLFRIERHPEPLDPRVIHPISPHELATRLSYFLWSSMPDDELLRLADDGMIREADALAHQVRRMLADPKSAALVENFAGQWLQLRDLENVTPDPDRFPDFNDALREAMRRESELFFAEVIREDRSILDLLDADFTYLNERLATHYGIEGVEGEQFRRVSLSDANRGGVLTHGSVLTITSNPTRTSPVKRGKWVLENLLATRLPPPPPDVPELEEDEKAVTAASLRERMEQHREKASCAVCHAQMDPPGFGLENFNAIGAWRDSDGEFPIDASGQLADGTTFNGPAELKAVLRTRSEDFCRCLAEKMLTYALGRGLENYDRRAVESIVQEVGEADHRFSSLVVAIVNSQPFQHRRGEEPTDE